MFAPMVPITFLVFLATFLAQPQSHICHQENPGARITVVGAVYCDTCSTSSFSRHSYFLPGVDVQLECVFKANSPKTAEELTFSANRTTDRNGIYRLEVPHLDGIDCADGMAIESVCQANLIGSSSSSCNIPGLKTSTNEISVKSKQDNLCIYSLNALSYRPSKKNITLCGNQKLDTPKTSLNSSKFFFPVPPYFFPPYGFFPPLPNFPPLPSLPPLPPLPPFPFFPSPPPPSLAFPFPPIPFLPHPPPPPSLIPPSLPLPFPPIPFLPHPPPPPPPLIPPSLPFPFPPIPFLPHPPPPPPPLIPPSLPFPFPPFPPFTPNPSFIYPPPP